MFPVMCQGHLTITYDDEIAEQPYGFFANEGPITIQAIVTPYDINGFGYDLDLNNPTGYHGITTSKKTLPCEQSREFSYFPDDNTTTLIAINTDDAALLDKTERHNYLSVANALTHEMMIFYNDNISLSLVNATTTNNNQPSQYKVRLTVNANGTSDTLTTTDTVINADDIVGDQLNIAYGFDSNGAGARYLTLTAISSTPTSTSFTTGATEDEVFQTGMKLYTRSGQTFTHIATVTSLTGATTVNVSLEAGQSLAGNPLLYTDVDKEASYLLCPFHISASYSNNTGAMNIFVNGAKVASKIHSAGSTTFSISGTDTFIGKNGSSSNDANTRKQFMGELHELAVLESTVEQFITTDTLIPNYRNTLLYYRFEEVDE